MSINKIRRLLTESVYYCERCDQYVDDDVDGSEVIDNQMVCHDCYVPMLMDRAGISPDGKYNGFDVEFDGDGVWSWGQFPQNTLGTCKTPEECTAAIDEHNRANSPDHDRNFDYDNEYESDFGDAPLDPDLDYQPVNVPRRMGESIILENDLGWEEEPQFDMDDRYEYEEYTIDYDGDWNWTRPNGEYGGSCESSAECEAAVDEDIRGNERAQGDHDHKMTFDKLYQDWWRRQERQREVDQYGVRGE